MSTQISEADMVFPSDWDVRHQMYLLEPPEQLQVPLSGKPAEAAPRANLVVTRSTSEQPIEDAAASLKEAITAQLPGSKVLEAGSFKFADGNTGAMFRVRFAADAHTQVEQRHVFRKDSAISTHFAATVDCRAQHKMQKLDDIMKSFTPKDQA